MKLKESFEYEMNKEIVNYGYNVCVRDFQGRKFYYASIWANGKINAGYDNVKIVSPALTNEKEVESWIKMFTDKVLMFVTGE